MENKETFDMTLPASEIDAAIIAAQSAITHKPQTLTPEQQAQARENIGAGPVVIDLDTYGETPINLILSQMLMEGGGFLEKVPIGNLMEHLKTDRPLCVKLTFSNHKLYMYGASVIREGDECIELCVFGMFSWGDGALQTHTVINATPYTDRSNADILMTVEIPGAYQEAAVELEAIVNGEY